MIILPKYSLIDYKFTKNNYAIFENLIEPSLKTILNFIKGEFNIVTVANLDIQIFNVLKSIHANVLSIMISIQKTYFGGNL